MVERGRRQLTIRERLDIFYDRLRQAAPATSADEAFELLSRVLEQVEDEYSGVAGVDSPGLRFRGRMYPPQEDRIRRFPDGTIEASSRRQLIRLAADGGITIEDHRTGMVVFTKPGGHADEGGSSGQE